MNEEALSKFGLFIDDRNNICLIDAAAVTDLFNEYKDSTGDKSISCLFENLIIILFLKMYSNSKEVIDV